MAASPMHAMPCRAAALPAGMGTADIRRGRAPTHLFPLSLRIQPGCPLPALGLAQAFGALLLSFGEVDGVLYILPHQSMPMSASDSLDALLQSVSACPSATSESDTKSQPSTCIKADIIFSQLSVLSI